MDDTLPGIDLAGVVLSERVRLRIPSRPEWITPTIDFLKDRAGLCGACQESRAGKLMLALHEALTNAIIHGNLGIASELKEQGNAFAATLAERCADPRYTTRGVTIDVDYDGQRCEWTFTDEGEGFDCERYLHGQVPDEAELWLVSGRGIMLMRAFMDGVRYEAGGRRVILTLCRTSGVEKRQHARQPLHRRVQVAPIRSDGSVDWEAAYDAVAQNLSPAGAGLLQARLTQAERVILGIEVDGQPLYIPAQVRHCRSLDEGLVELGCRFLFGTEPLPAQITQQEIEQRRSVEESVEELLNRPRGQPLKVGEQRTYPRETYTERIEVIGPPPDTREGRPALVGFARDLSKSGLSFIATAPVALEVRTIVLPRPSESPLRLRAQIVRCVAIATGFYDVGARFLAVEDEAAPP